MTNRLIARWMNYFRCGPRNFRWIWKQDSILLQADFDTNTLSIGIAVNTWEKYPERGFLFVRGSASGRFASAGKYFEPDVLRNLSIFVSIDFVIFPSYCINTVG